MDLRRRARRNPLHERILMNRPHRPGSRSRGSSELIVAKIGLATALVTLASVLVDRL